jgi:hypothetical protein
MFVGCFLIVFGMMMLSLAKSYHEVFLAQALCVGLGAGLVYVPALAAISTQFTTRRPIAIGLASAGFEHWYVFHKKNVAAADSIRRHHLPHHVPKIAASNGIWLGCPCHSLRQTDGRLSPTDER